MPTTYPFDPTGTNPSNRIANEQQVVTSTDFRNSNYVIPTFAPFFGNNVVLSFRDTLNNPRTLVENVDYYFAHKYISASRACATPIYGSICFLNTNTAGVLQISYNTLGGIWTIAPAEIASILADSLHNPRITAWEQVTSIPVNFPVIDHEWNLNDMVGMTAVVDELEEIRIAILANSVSGLPSHTGRVDNPHSVTKSQVGLDNVLNYPLATTAQAQAGAVNTAYMTPALTKIAIDAAGSSSTSTHISRTDNPHSTTKSQVGLDNVDNYSTASNAIALTGVSTTTFMTPATTKAVVDVVATAVTAHAARTDNPHATNRNHVGLSNVENYRPATTNEARLGVLPDAYMTPLLTAAAITAQALPSLNAHIADANNPHSTTKSQVGLGSVQNYPVATQVEAEAGVSNATYMTPARTIQAIAAQATTTVSAHANLSNNPHAVTKAQVALGNVLNYGVATSAEAIAGISNTLYMTPVATAAAVAAGKYSEPPGDIVFTVSPIKPTGTNRLLVQGQAVSLTTYATLLPFWCGATLNANADLTLRADFFYRCTDAANPDTTRSNTGTFLVLPPPGYFLRPINTGTTGSDANRQQFKLQADDNLAHTHLFGLGLRSGGDTGRPSGSTSGITAMFASDSSGGTEARPKNWPVYVWICH
jgi:hypothetical protein